MHGDFWRCDNSYNIFAMIIHLYQQQFIHLANGSYLHLMEYMWKNNQTSEKTVKTVNGDLTTEETLLIDEDEEQGMKQPVKVSVIHSL